MQDANGAFSPYRDCFVCFLIYDKIANNTEKQYTILWILIGLEIVPELFKLSLHCLHSVWAVPND